MKFVNRFKKFVKRLLPKKPFSFSKKSIFDNKPKVVESNYEWLETIFLVDDEQAQKLSDWTVGYFHCLHCETYQGFAFKLPPIETDEEDNVINGVSIEAHNARVDFFHEHSHGDLFILMVENYYVEE
ncbi:MAG TPA: hypothetical protein DIW23_07205 [Anaerolineae bacterium]|nr:hypothetical protein [Anaerolineae bacterium]